MKMTEERDLALTLKGFAWIAGAFVVALAYIVATPA